MTADNKFWLTTPLSQMTDEQWESLCDGCGKCCLNKLEDDDTGEIYYTNAACKLLNHETIRCADYENRMKLVPECVSLTIKKFKNINWLPDSCSYVLIDQGKDLPSWHHLKSGSPDTIHKAGYSIKGDLICETKVDDLIDHMIKDNEF